MKEFSLTELKEFSLEVYNKLDLSCEPVFLCVGSDRVIADSLAPIIGEILVNKYNIPAYVYGGLDYNVNGNNLSFVINYIESVHPRSQLILIDATLSDSIGSVIVTNGSFAGLGKILPIKKLGNFSILGVVGKKGKTFMLNTTRLQMIKSMADFMAKGIAMAISVKERFLKLSKIDNVRHK